MFQKIFKFLDPDILRGNEIIHYKNTFKRKKEKEILY